MGRDHEKQATRARAVPLRPPSSSLTALVVEGHAAQFCGNAPFKRITAEAVPRGKFRPFAQLARGESRNQKRLTV